MNEEMLDIYNSKGKHLGVKSRKEVHLKGYWHKTFHCWIVYKNAENEPCVLMQKRSQLKKSAPGKLDSCVAGHIEAGEGIEGGLREFKEETGLTIKVNDLISLGTRITVSDYKENTINKEFQEVFFVHRNVNLSDFQLPPEEVAGMIELPVKKCIALFSEEVDEIEVKGVFVDSPENIGKPIIQNIYISREDFISFVDNFHFKIMILAERYLLGEKHLFI